MEILTVSKGENLGTNELKRLFKSSENLKELEEKVKKAKERIFLSWDTVEIRDKTDDKIPIDEYLIRKYEVYVNERNGAISDNHSNKIIGQTLDYKPMKHPKTGEMGILTLNKIFNNYEIDDKVWKGIQTKERKGVSVGGESHKQKDKFEDNKPIRELKQMDVLEKASTETPCNPEALIPSFSEIAKSEEVVKPFGKWSSFADCVHDNLDKENPEAYCAWMEHKITGKWPTEKTIKKAEENRVEKKLDKLKDKLDKLD